MKVSIKFGKHISMQQVSKLANKYMIKLISKLAAGRYCPWVLNPNDWLFLHPGCQLKLNYH